ncbi:hypothetical protein M427DRAFT_122185 [Gonapodya prolifera JEL478]|uniref:Domain of unknown function at the cortex 1 domain-containing protein n=1 Tax=Gonapodya prolifera (strain JEL478) TaxID=1344416 RepID=A0A139AKZ5_GONPJ|nr:hypothetical protein M427DRAFT_122185 [Gonapodya prolifera JEL478]|eukprot:KXS17095.1 hypothetical protein M427DRAFT_122185 [Gonapodya prolifera JEL478]
MMSGRHKKTKLRVYVGPSANTKAVHNVNDDANPVYIESPHCCANVAMRIRDFAGFTPNNTPPIPNTPYFGSRKRNFSMQMQVRFKKPVSADSLMFGGMFDGKVAPPMGAWVALKFAGLIDPAIAYDIYADRPWILSPMFCSMNIVDVRDAPCTWKELEEKYGCTSIVDQVAPSQSRSAPKLSSAGLASSVRSDHSSADSIGNGSSNTGKSSKSFDGGRPSAVNLGISRVLGDNGTPPNEATPRSSFSSLRSVRSVAPPTSNPGLREVALQAADVAKKAGRPSVKEILGEWECGGEKELQENNKGLVGDIKEGAQTVGPIFGESNVTERRRWFQTASNRESMILSPDKVYNLEIFAPFFNWNTFDVNLGIAFNVAPYINDQPIRIVMQSRDREITYVCFEMKLARTDEEIYEPPPPVDEDESDDEEPAASDARAGGAGSGSKVAAVVKPADGKESDDEDEFFDA